MPPADSSDPSGASGASGPSGDPADPAEDDTLDLSAVSEALVLLCEAGAGAGSGAGAGEVAGVEAVEAGAEAGAGAVVSSGDLLNGLGGWGPMNTGCGTFQLVPVLPARDLAVVTRWMNDPAVAAFWELSGPAETAGRHVRAQLDGDGRSTPCLGVLDERAMSYWEIYRADLDPLARYYPARPHDTGIHLLIGRIADRGQGLGGTLLRAVADHILARRPACARVVAEPDVRNTASVAAFLAAGFRYSAELRLPGKRAALMVRERRLRHVM